VEGLIASAYSTSSKTVAEGRVCSAGRSSTRNTGLGSASVRTVKSEDFQGTHHEELCPPRSKASELNSRAGLSGISNSSLG